MNMVFQYLKYFTIAVASCFLLVHSVYGQQIKKNTLFFQASPFYSKTNFTNLPEVGGSWLTRLYESKKPSKGILGYYYGFGYIRSLNPKWKIGIGLGYAFNGQQSPNFFKINGISMQDLEDLEDYGGTSYRITYKSYEVSMFVEYIYKQKGKFNYSFLAGGDFNVYYEVEAENFKISKATGKKESGGVHATYFHAKRVGTLGELKRHVKLGLWRIGVFIGWGIDYEIFPFLSARAAPTVRYYTNLNDTSVANTVVEGGLFNFGCDLGVSLKF